MLNRPEQDLRQIKWLLMGILAFVFLIALAVVPGLLKLILLSAVAFGVAMFVLTLSSTARAMVTQMWNEVRAIWRR